MVTTIYDTPKHVDEPESIRVKGHRIHMGHSDVMAYVDVFQYADGTVRAVSVRQKGHPHARGSRYSLAQFLTMDFTKCVALHVANETRIGAYTGDHALTI